jgi:hypothetical protein
LAPSRCTFRCVTLAPSATSISVTALVRYGGDPDPAAMLTSGPPSGSRATTWLSITVSRLCRSAHTSTRAWLAVRAAAASVTNRRWTGTSASISLRITTNAPSANAAWLSATNGCPSGRAIVPSVRSSASASSRTASAHGMARTPSGSPSSRDSPAS